MSPKKKFVFAGAAAAVLVSGVIVVGIVGTTENTPSPSPTASSSASPSPSPSTPATNPITSDETVLATAGFASGVQVEVRQVASGYPTEVQVNSLSAEPSDGSDIPLEELPEGSESIQTTPSTPEEEEEPTLTSQRRVVALVYTLSNPTDEAVDATSFSPYSATFTVEGMEEPATSTTDAYALFASRGYSSLPGSFTLEPGGTLSWAVDWFIPETETDAETIPLQQNLFLNNEWLNISPFTLQIQPEGA